MSDWWEREEIRLAAEQAYTEISTVVSSSTSSLEDREIESRQLASIRVVLDSLADCQSRNDPDRATQQNVVRHGDYGPFGAFGDPVVEPITESRSGISHYGAFGSPAREPTTEPTQEQDTRE